MGAIGQQHGGPEPGGARHHLRQVALDGEVELRIGEGFVDRGAGALEEIPFETDIGPRGEILFEIALGMGERCGTAAGEGPVVDADGREADAHREA